MTESSFINVCKTDEISDNKMKIFNIRNIEFVITNRDNKYSALYNKCPHMGGSLGDGYFDDSGYLTCPLHNWQFDLVTGKGPEGFEDSVPTFDLKVEENNILINESQLLELAKNRDYLVKFDHNTKGRFESA